MVEKLNLKLPEWLNEQQAKDFVYQNRAGLAAGGVIIGVLLVFMLLYFRHQGIVQVRSSAIFNEAQNIYYYRIPGADGNVTPLVASDDEKYTKAQQYFQQIVDSYPSSRFCPAAIYYVGNCRYQLRQYSAALDAYAQFLDRYSRHILTPQATLGRADSLEQLGRHEEALGSFRKVMESRGPLVVEASLGAVRCLLKMTETDRANSQRWWTEAAGILQKLSEGNNPQGQRASRMLQKLLVDLSKSK